MKINLNSPDGNVFQLVSIVVGLMKRAKLPTSQFKRDIFTSKNYEEIVNQCKLKCNELSEILGEKIEFYSSEEYQMQ